MGGFHIIKIITSFCVTFKGAFEQKPQFSCCENYQNPFAEKKYYVHIGFSVFVNKKVLQKGSKKVSTFNTQ